MDSLGMTTNDHLQCSCGYMAFRCICFPEPGVMRLTCFGCNQTHEISVSAASNLTAWHAAEQAPLEPLPVKSGYKYKPML